MSTSRGRSCVLLANEEMHRRRLQLDEAAVAAVLGPAAVAAPQKEPPPQHHGWKDEDRTDQGERICDCKAAHTVGARLYRNNAKAWEQHQKTKAHQCWALGNVNAPRLEVIGAVAFEPFANHAYAQNPECTVLTAIAADLSLTKVHAQKFAEAGVDDRDAPWLSQLMPRNWQKMFGISFALAEQLSDKLCKLGNWPFLEADDFNANTEHLFMHDESQGEEMNGGEIENAVQEASEVSEPNAPPS